MNKTILKEAINKGIKLKNNHFVYNSNTVDVNKFLHEVTKIQFTHSLSDCVNICKEKLFKEKIKTVRFR